MTRSPRMAATVGVAALALLTAGLAGSATAGPGTAASAASAAPAGPAAPAAKSAGEFRGNYDSRDAVTAAGLKSSARTLRTHGASYSKLADDVGGDAEVQIDPLTKTPANLASRTGFLTGPSGKSADQVALDFVRANLKPLGLEPGDVASLRKVRQFTDINKITHVYWSQVVDGRTVFGNGLRAHVDRAGRLIALQGAPVASAASLAKRAAAPTLGKKAAIDAAVDDGDAGGELRPGATAEQVWFLTTDGLRAAWLTYTEPGSAQGYQHVIDARTGRTLYRHSTVNFEKGDAQVHENYPGASGIARGGQQKVVNLFRLKYLPRSATWMRGRYASVWADVNDDNKVQPNEKTKVPNARKKALFPFRPFKTAAGQTPCTERYLCTWNPNVADSWKKNKNQDGVQGLYFTSKFAEWLAGAPFGFTRELGNFDRRDGDPVHVHIMDGADTADGLPDGNHVNNANFSTPPDGTPPVMQMYLNQAPYLAASSTNAFDNIGHEYTHGLSNRLVVDAQGFSTLNSYQAGAMGEGWSDFYSFDYLVHKGLVKNKQNVSGELMYDRYLSKDRTYTRSQAIDCKIGKESRLCPGGGYTFGDIAGVLGTEVHSAGEVWAQTLWDIYEQYGHNVTMRLVTSAMTLSVDDPSMLDMRDAIITADKVIYSRAHTAGLWKAFAKRGFGFYAALIDGGDPQPVEDFNVPPPAGTPTGTITGTVSTTAGDPVAGAIVAVAGHTSGTLGSYTAVTGADGSYEIDDVVSGTYPKVVVLADGYETNAVEVTVPPGGEGTADFEIRRDWAAESGGASVASFDGPDYSPFGCGPAGLIDLSQGTGWGSITGSTEEPVTSEAQVEPKSIVIELPQAIDITSFAVDPGSTCGDPGSASTAGYTIEVSTTADGPWTEVASGTFTEEDRGVMVPIDATVPPGQSFVRYTMESPQVPDYSQCPDAFAGCQYMDSSEFAVYDD